MASNPFKRAVFSIVPLALAAQGCTRQDEAGSELATAEAALTSTEGATAGAAPESAAATTAGTAPESAAATNAAEPPAEGDEGTVDAGTMALTDDAQAPSPIVVATPPPAAESKVLAQGKPGAAREFTEMGWMESANFDSQNETAISDVRAFLTGKLHVTVVFVRGLSKESPFLAKLRGEFEPLGVRILRLKKDDVPEKEGGSFAILAPEIPLPGPSGKFEPNKKLAPR